MDVKLSIGEEEVGMDASIRELVQKDEGGTSLNMLDDGRDSMKEEKTARTAEQQDPAEVYAAARKLADVIKGANVEDIISTIETLARQTDSSAIFNFRGLSWGSLLHIAAATGKSNILRLLLDHVDAHLIAAQDDWGNTPLHIATKAKALEVARMLIRRARDLPNFEEILMIKNKHGNTALHEAVLSRDVGLVSLLMEDLEPVYWENVDRKCPLYLALDTDNSEILRVLFSLSLEPSRIQGMPPIHGAIVRCNYDLVAKILEWNMKLFAMIDSRGGNVFHLAAFLNKRRVFKFLRPETEYLARERDMNGDLPIHIASKMGHVALIKKLLPVSQLVNARGESILHVAAKYGRASAVTYILGHPDLGMLINERDHDGNTPSHLAAKYLQPSALIHLLLDERVNPFLLNHQRLAALDIAVKDRRRGLRPALVFTLLMGASHKRLDLIILKPEARDKEFPRLDADEILPAPGRVRNIINTLLLVATLVTTVTFTAGFAIPGGLNGSDPASKDYRGMATMLDNRMFQAFTICNTFAMFCSMTSVVGFMLAYLTGIPLATASCRLAGLLLSIALLPMSAAFLLGVTLTVGKLPWLATTILILGSIFFLIITGALFSMFIVPLSGCFIYFRNHLHPIRPLVYWFIHAYINIFRETFILDDTKEDRTARKTSASPPLDGGRED
ncbi:protein ACCELERATED CELL DEATH 6-like [Syzygium oleosum]|uniref:protein ACCELERATED CELL DEATH 6-like n=1 Tax=Syzygium oleosum TaxID=219896 RepID=UPI0011D1DCC8|nr:protein ACCELERATED CELL DEATH 6-like [Syzygium oleosum]